MDLRLFLRRFVTVSLGAALSVALLTALLAWVALQAEWELPDPAGLNTPSVVYDRNGAVIARFTSEQDRRFVDFEDVAPTAWQAIVANEDTRFFEHDGVDPAALLRAVVRNVATGGIEQGGSTITQQYVRNGLEGVGRDRTIVRKIKEAVLSTQLERDLTKEEILERYLNTVYFGEGAYGIEAAALTYFDVPASQLTPLQSASLAQTLPAPSLRNPRVDPEGAQLRAEEILDKMVAQGYLTPSEATAATAQPLDVKPRVAPPVTHPYFVQYVRHQLESNYGRASVLTGGLQVTTTIDPEVQAAVEAAVAEELPPQEGDNADVDAGVVVLDPKTGDILGVYGGRDFNADNADLALQSDRQNGSTFKPIAYITALEQGIAPAQRYPAPGAISLSAAECQDYDGPVWRPTGGPGGTLTMTEGLVRSVNTVFAQVACDVGGPAIVDVARRIGVRNDIGSNPAVALGTPAEDPSVTGHGSAGGASVLDMASAFATLANDGISCPARSILEVRTAIGTQVDPPVEVTATLDMEQRPRPLTEEELEARPDALKERDQGHCKGTLDPDIARITTQALQQVVARSTGRRADIGRPQAGKTGTTNNEVDAWFVGYTPDVAIAVWVGHRNCGGVTEANRSDTRCILRNIEGFRKVQGGTIPALIWKNVAQRVLADVPPNRFLEPGELEARGRRRPGPPRSAGVGAPDPSEQPSPSEEPSPDGSPSPDDGGTTGTSGGDTDGGGDDGGSSGLPTTGGDDGGGSDGSDDGGGCLPLVEDCDVG